MPGTLQWPEWDHRAVPDHDFLVASRLCQCPSRLSSFVAANCRKITGDGAGHPQRARPRVSGADRAAAGGPEGLAKRTARQQTPAWVVTFPVINRFAACKTKRCIKTYAVFVASFIVL